MLENIFIFHGLNISNLQTSVTLISPACEVEGFFDAQIFWPFQVKFEKYECRRTLYVVDT
jgi:hypothetical protein